MPRAENFASQTWSHCGLFWGGNFAKSPTFWGKSFWNPLAAGPQQLRSRRGGGDSAPGMEPYVGRTGAPPPHRAACRWPGRRRAPAEYRGRGPLAGEGPSERGLFSPAGVHAKDVMAWHVCTGWLHLPPDITSPAVHSWAGVQKTLSGLVFGEVSNSPKQKHFPANFVLHFALISSNQSFPSNFVLNFVLISSNSCFPQKT